MDVRDRSAEARDNRQGKHAHAGRATMRNFRMLGGFPVSSGVEIPQCKSAVYHVPGLVSGS
jgi:hypothetical protein